MTVIYKGLAGKILCFFFYIEHYFAIPKTIFHSVTAIRLSIIFVRCETC